MTPLPTAPSRRFGVARITDGLSQVRLDSLTSLRFFAALAVFTHHFTGLSNGGGVAHAPAIFPYSEIGVNGVTFFFVLSGFLLTWSHRPEQRIGVFYWRRVGRIWPAHLVATIPAMLAFYVWAKGSTNWFSTISSLFLMQTWFPHVSPTLPGNPVSWTLSVELLFYALFPFIVRVVLRLRTRTLAVLAVAGMVAMWAVDWVASTHMSGLHASWVMRLPVIYLPEFLLGMCLATACRRGWRVPLHPAVLLVPFAAYVVLYTRRADWVSHALSAQLDYTVRPLVAVFSGLLIISFVQREIAGRRGLLNARPLVLLGAWSYCFYLVHQTVNQLIIDHWGRPRVSNENLFTMLGVAVVAVAAAWALYTFVEEPGRKWWFDHMPQRFRTVRPPVPPARSERPVGEDPVPVGLSS